jgi:ATP synthase protein I
MADLPRGDALKALGQVSTIGLSFVLALVMGFGAGFWLDQRLGTSPWLSLAGFATGLTAGVLNVVRIMKGLERDERRRRSDGPR